MVLDSAADTPLLLEPAEVPPVLEENIAGRSPFLLTCDDTLVGDADLRHIVDDTAEVAIMIGDRARQGQGLGTGFAILLHAFAFQTLGLLCTYAAIIPENAAPGCTCIVASAPHAATARTICVAQYDRCRCASPSGCSV